MIFKSNSTFYQNFSEKIPWTSLKRRPSFALHCLRCSPELVVHLESLCLRGTYMANVFSLHYKQEVLLFPSRDYLVYLTFLSVWCHGIPLHMQVGFSRMQKKRNFIQAVLPQPFICLAAYF